MPIVPVADFAPDAASIYRPDVAPVAHNCYPRADSTDGPLQGQVEASSSLSAACRGAFSLRDQTGTAYVFAGTATALYELSSLSWTDRTRLSASAVDAYAVPTAEHWRFAQFGERVIATDYNDAIQTYTLGGGAPFANLSAAAPKAKYIATIEPGFLVTGYYNSGSVVGAGLWWSGFNDATSWPTLGTAAAAAAQSDAQTMQGGGVVTGILPAIGGAAGAVFTERAIYRMEYIGPPQVFGFRELDRSRGCIAPQSLVQVGSTAFFLSEDGFCGCNGVEVSQIGLGRVDRFFFSTVDQSQLHRVYGAADFARKLIVWAFPASGASDPNRWLIYNFATNRWRYGDDSALAVQYLSTFRQAGYTLDTLDTPLPGGPDSSGAFTVDSPTYQGGNRFLGAFNTSRRLVSFSGSNLAARIETGDADAGGRRVLVQGIRPITDAVSPTASVGYRDLLESAVSYTTATTPGADDVCPQRISTRYGRARINVPAADTWTYLAGADITFRAEGRR